jgi:integrase
MKAGRPHRVPLSPAAVELLRTVPRFTGVDLVFPAPRGGSLSDMALSALVRRMAVKATPHGFRSTFRDWAGERTSIPREVAEAALARSWGGTALALPFVAGYSTTQLLAKIRAS